MTPLLRQFLDEGRGLIQEATRHLLVLEREGESREGTAIVFRAFHTLKGSSGLFEVGAMTRMLHVAEDLLAGIREGRTVIGAGLVDALLACLDQVGQWLDTLEASGELPDGADRDADSLISTLRSAAGLGGPAVRDGGSPAPQAGAADAGADFLAAFGEGERREALRLLREAGPGAGILAIRYEPRAGCFFDGDDPLELFRGLPGLAAFRIEAGSPWPVLEEFDPFSCSLVFRALAVGQEERVRNAFRLVSDQVRIVPLDLEMPEGPAVRKGTAVADAVIAEQVRLLHMPGCPRPEVAGRIGSAAAAVINVLLYEGRQDDVGAVEMAADEALAKADPRILSAAILRMAEHRRAEHRLAEGGASAASAPLTAAAGQDQDTVRTGAAQRVLRVDEARVDHLMRLVGEMAVAKNGLEWLVRSSGADDATVRRLQDLHGTLDRLTREMHGAVLRIRMLPLRQVFQSFPRLVRDLSNRLGKPVRLVLEGEDAEADKAIVEQLFEPVLHLVRNSLDHGVEAQEHRRTAGKPNEATLTLRGFQSRGQIIVEVEDDGRGIDAAAIRRRAVERGLLDAAAAAELTDEDAVQLVFAPGLTTAEAVSELSGRGVGMDAVRAAVEKTGGSVTVRSRPGQGTTVRLALPLTLSSVRILTVQAGGRRLGVPMDVVSQTIRLPRGQIRRVKEHEVFVLRDRVIPVVELSRLLGLESPVRSAGEDARLLVVEVDGRVAGVEVDGFAERLDAVLRPMDGLLSGIHGYLGTTLLGNGEVLLVLDLKEILR
ncbi:chemotaxis protein CheA [Arenibaculum pallidiluteum]|uniref:chemotaxis protein CheA n=1 Tax=Arenibaculum pallidiluteum TaxID=2812559 RepID=UPI001A9614F3|nr:chemotaxis protein CheA [Arenibaculum pallidiluteum]